MVKSLLKAATPSTLPSQASCSYELLQYQHFSLRYASMYYVL